MEKMDLIQTCLNNRLLEANISCFTYAWLFCKPAACEPLHKRVPTSGAVGFCGCTSLEMLSPEEQSPLVETQGHNPGGGAAARGDPKKSQRQTSAEESLQTQKGPLGGSSLNSVLKLLQNLQKFQYFWQPVSLCCASHPPSSSNAALTQRWETKPPRDSFATKLPGKQTHSSRKINYWNWFEIS